MPKITRRRFLAYGIGFGCTVLGTVRIGLVAERLGIGLVGLDEQGCQHLQALHEMPGVHVAAICDEDPARLAAAMNSIPRGVSPPASHVDYRRILERADIDAIALRVPQFKRMPMLEAAASAGKNVMIAQPAAWSLPEASRLLELAQCYRVSIEHLPEDPDWDREALVALLSTPQIGAVERVEIRDTVSELKTGPATPFLDALEVGSQLLSAQMPCRGLAFAPVGGTPAWSTSAEIELGEHRYLTSHVSRRTLPQGLERRINILAKGSRGSAHAMVEFWSEERPVDLPPISWTRAMVAAHASNRECWTATTERTAATCANAAIIRQACAQGAVKVRQKRDGNHDNKGR